MKIVYKRNVKKYLASICLSPYILTGKVSMQFLYRVIRMISLGIFKILFLQHSLFHIVHYILLQQPFENQHNQAVNNKQFYLTVVIQLIYEFYVLYLDTTAKDVPY